MRKGAFPGVNKVTVRKAGEIVGVYHYAFRGGPCIWSRNSSYGVGSEEYAKRYREALAGDVPCSSDGDYPAKPSTPVKTATVMVDRWLASPKVRQKAPVTKKAYEDYAEKFRAWFSDTPIEAFNDRRIRSDIAEWRSQWAHSPRNSDYAASVATMIVTAAYDEGLVEYNHALKLGKFYRADRASAIWTPEKIQKWVEAAERMSWPHMVRVMTLGTNSGLRPEDMIHVGMQHVVETEGRRFLAYRTSKRKRVATPEITAELAEMIDSTPPDRLNLIWNSQGRPFSNRSMLSRAFARVSNKAGIEGLTLYDTRGTAATKLFESGEDLLNIAAHMGWSPQYCVEVIESYIAAVPSVAIARRLSNASRTRR